MLREETAKLLMMIQGAYPNYKPDNKTVTINTWNLALSDIPFDLAQKAFLAYLRADTKGFAPAPGQLIALVHELNTPQQLNEEIKSQMPVIPVEIVKERGCTFCPYYLGNYEKQPRCMMKICAWDDENERFHPVLRGLIPFYKEKMEKAEEKFLAMKKIYTTLLGMFADEMKQEELEKDECYGCAYGKCGPCIGICYKSMKA